jgi:MOSC domain-containing protein YiiM
MRVVSINAGPLQPLGVQREVIKTGFYKGPCEGEVRVAQIGIEGDARVACATDMNRAVFFYQSSYYDQWRSELGRDLPYGTIGENITFDGPDDKDFFLGDILRIGSTVLRITQPRFPCRKLTARMQEGDDFPLRYLKSGRLGFFCNVIDEGTMSAGDPIALVHREADPYPLTEFARVTFLEPRDAEGLRRMLACPVLVPEWRIRVERTLRRALGVEGWSDYRPLNVARRHAENLDTVSLDLEDPAGETLPDFVAGQFVTLRLEVPGETNPVVRTYTINGRSASGRGYSIAVKRITEGDGNGSMTGVGLRLRERRGTRRGRADGAAATRSVHGGTGLATDRASERRYWRDADDGNARATCILSARTSGVLHPRRAVRARASPRRTSPGADDRFPTLAAVRQIQPPVFRRPERT